MVIIIHKFSLSLLHQTFRNVAFPQIFHKPLEVSIHSPLMEVTQWVSVGTTNLSSQDVIQLDLVNQDSPNRAILNRHIQEPLNQAFRFMVRHPMQTVAHSHLADTTNQDSFNQDMVNQDSAPILHRPLVDAYNRAILNRHIRDPLNQVWHSMVRHPMQTVAHSHLVDTTHQDSFNQDMVNQDSVTILRRSLADMHNRAILNHHIQEPLNQVFPFMVLSSSLVVDH